MLSTVVIIFPFFILIYKITKFRIRIAQYEQQQANKGKPTGSNLHIMHFNTSTVEERESVFENHPSFVRDQHEYDDISPTRSRSESEKYDPIISIVDSDKTDDEYLTPL